MARKREAVVVNDEATKLEEIAQFVSTHGYSVTQFKDAILAWHYIETARPDVVITNHRMSEMSGLELLGRVRQRFNNMPVIVLSDSASHAIEKDGGIYVSKNHFALQLPGALREAEHLLAMRAK